MQRLLAIALVLVSSTAGLRAQSCEGTDLREGLLQHERAEIAANLSTTPFPEGLLWQAERDGQTLYVMGTIHVHDTRLEPVVARAAPLIQASDLMLVEATPETEAAMQREIAENPGRAFILQGPTLIDLLPPETWADIKAAAEARGLPGVLAAKHQPWFLSLSLALPVCLLQQQAEGLEGLDARLMTIATKAERPLQALDTPTVLFDALASDPLDLQLEFLRLTPLDPQYGLDQLATLKNQYFEERTAESIATSRILARRVIDMDPVRFDDLFDIFMTRLLDDRNNAWIEKILASEARTIFIAVGAGHLPGNTGLLQQLDQKGFTITRLPL